MRHCRELLRRSYLNEPHRALLCVRERVRHEWGETFTTAILAEYRFEHDAATCRYRVRLDTFQGVRRIAVRVHAVEHCADDVEVAVEVGTGVDYVEAYTDAS